VSYEKYHKTTIDCSKIFPHTKELVERCGTAHAAAEYALVSPQTIMRIMNSVHCTVQQATARKIIIALEHRRKEDRTMKSVHTRFLNARRKQAQIEEQQMSLLGY
jgi:hypothetical protein